MKSLDAFVYHNPIRAVEISRNLLLIIRFARSERRIRIMEQLFDKLDKKLFISLRNKGRRSLLKKKTNDHDILVPNKEDSIRIQRIFSEKFFMIFSF